MSVTEKSLKLLKSLPRVTCSNVRPSPARHPKVSGKTVTKTITGQPQRNRPSPRGPHHGHQTRFGKSGQASRGTLPPLGYEGGQVPFHVRIPTEPYYKGFHVRRQYPPLSLLQLQRLIDLGRVNPDEPIDLTTLCNTKVIRVVPERNHYGINLTDEGADIFSAKINIEVQWAHETVIAIIERLGGTITTRFYDAMCVQAMVDPLLFFKSMKPIPRCKLPPEDAILDYSDPAKRGYLADPDKVREKREELAQKYGYVLPDITQDPQMPMLLQRKHNRQIWYGLEPGWIVNLKDREILKPTSEQLQEFYAAN